MGLSGNRRRFAKRALLTVLVSFVAVLAFYGGELIDAVRFLEGVERQSEIAKQRGEKAYALAQNCAPCHGFDGNNLSSLYPSLAGLPAPYIEAQLRAFAEDRRDEPMMGPLAKSLSEEEISLLAGYYASSPTRRNAYLVADDARLKEATPLTTTCTACHGARLRGDPNQVPETPRLGGQGERYLTRQLKDYRSGKRADPTGAMNALAQTMSDEDIARLAYALSHNSQEANHP